MIRKKVMYVTVSSFFLILLIQCVHSNVEEARFINFDKFRTSKPNIIVIMADDLGWDDVSLHGSNHIYTPNIDALGYYGITLNRHYVPPMCTPSRASLMTGKYPIHTGMQHLVILSDEPWGLGLNEKVLPEYLKEAGYATHLVGKWHLGFYKKAFNPIKRHFDGFFGYLGPFIDYWDHSLQMLNKYGRGYDMRYNETIYYETKGIYATNLFTDQAVNVINNHYKRQPLFLLLNHLAPHTANEDDPMQAPPEEIKKFSYIENPRVRTLAAMISLLDQSVGKVVKALKEQNMLENTVILFYSDNGAPSVGQHSNSGSNGPLRGQKDSPWEGAVRSVATIWSPLLKSRQRVSNSLYHVSDWLPTFCGLAGIRIDNKVSKFDGVDIWKSLSNNIQSPRDEVVHVIDDIYNYASYTKGRYKYINGTRLDGQYDGWLGRVVNNGPLNVNYPNLVKSSDVGIALSRYTQRYRRSLEEEYELHENEYANETIIARGYNPSPGISERLIAQLRNEATIRCITPTSTQKNSCQPLKKPCLFDIIADPCEYINLAEDNISRVRFMEYMVNKFRTSAVSPRNKPGDPNANPACHSGRWTWWIDEPNSSCVST